MRGGARPGAGRKPGGSNRPRAQQAADELIAEMKRAAREHAREMHSEKVRLTVLPPMATPYVHPDASAMEFLTGLMHDDRLPLLMRKDCAIAVLPYQQPKPLLGVKDQRRLAAFDDDDDDDPMAVALRGN